MPYLTARRQASVGTALAVGALLLFPGTLRAQGEIYGPADLTASPRLVSSAYIARLVARSLPDELRRSGTGGTVQLQFVIDANGKVEPNSVEVLAAPVPALGAAAKAVAEKMEFVPGRRESGAVRARVQLPITFKP